MGELEKGTHRSWQETWGALKGLTEGINEGTIYRGLGSPTEMSKR